MNSHPRKRRRLAAFTASTEGDACPSIRRCSDLYAVAETVKCAFLNECCVPCAYKIASFDVALDTEVCQRIPNQRPELCPRSSIVHASSSISKDDDAYPLGYQQGMSVLTVGDGDFSFSVALARFGCSVVATSYESEETIRAVYDSVGVGDHIKELESSGAKILYNVDATNLKGTLQQPFQSVSLADRKFQRIVWNFPCSAVAKGQDGQNIEMDNNKQLVRSFVESATSFCRDHGQIHINHKTKPPFNQWKIDEVAVMNTNNVRFLYRVVLDRNLFHPYIPRKALDRKSFPCHDACTYVFEVLCSPTELNESAMQPERNALSLFSNFSDKNLSDLNNTLRSIPSFQLIRMTPQLIQQLRSRLLQQLSTTTTNGKANHGKKTRQF